MIWNLETGALGIPLADHASTWQQRDNGVILMLELEIRHVVFHPVRKLVLTASDGK